MGHSCLFFFIFVSSIQFVVNKICRWLHSSRGTLVLEATTVPIEPQPLPFVLYFFQCLLFISIIILYLLLCYFSFFSLDPLCLFLLFPFLSQLGSLFQTNTLKYCWSLICNLKIKTKLKHKGFTAPSFNFYSAITFTFIKFTL